MIVLQRDEVSLFMLMEVKHEWTADHGENVNAVHYYVVFFSSHGSWCLFLALSLADCVTLSKWRDLWCPWAPFPILIKEYITARRQLWSQLRLLGMKYSHRPGWYSSHLSRPLSLFTSSFFLSLSFFCPDSFLLGISLSLSLCLPPLFSLWGHLQRDILQL